MLLIDAGNSRIKSAQLVTGQLNLLATIVTDSNEPPPDWASLNGIERVFVSSVASDAVNKKIAAWVQTIFDCTAEFAATRRDHAGMHSNYEDPSRLGVDRWLAALAAYHLTGGAVLVADAGTALTIDIVNGEGTHLGGSISPGLNLMIESLTRNTAQLAVDKVHGVDQIATNTSAAISSGCIDAMIGGIAQMELRVGRALGGKLKRLATGGGAPLMIAQCPLEFEHVPDLVLQGLRIYAESLS